MTFEEYYSNTFGVRWPSLKQALLSDSIQTLYPNPFIPAKSTRPAFAPWLSGCEVFEGGELKRDESTGLLEGYVLDPASVVVARALGVQPGDRVLDLCAAPGGKTLVLAEGLVKSGELTSNEPSEGRRHALFKVIQNYIPTDQRPRFWVKGWDGQRVGMAQPGAFDRILVDAPCSGERHLLQNKKELQAWTPQRIKKLAQKQFSLLASAALAVKEGGVIVYSTCALSTQENDDVVEKLLERRPQWVCEHEEAPSPFAEKTKWGWNHWPDRCGFGPMYFSRLRLVGV